MENDIDDMQGVIFTFFIFPLGSFSAHSVRKPGFPCFRFRSIAPQRLTPTLQSLALLCRNVKSTFCLSFQNNDFCKLLYFFCTSNRYFCHRFVYCNFIRLTHTNPKLSKCSYLPVKFILDLYISVYIIQKS